MSSERNTKTVLVCSVGSAPYFSQTFFDQLGVNAVRVASGDDLISELATLRPIGVMLLAGDSDVFQGSSWLSKLEQKILFEGLRVVLAVRDDGANPAKLFGSRVQGPFHLVRCLGLRDLIIYNENMTDKDMQRALFRVRFAFGLGTSSPFDDHFRLVATHEELVEIGVPGRISEVEDQVHLVIESAVYMQPGSRVVLRLMGFKDDPVDVPASVIENLPSGLRFNFGNSVRARVDDSHSHVLDRLLSAESPTKIVNRPMRRAMVVVRSPVLRQTLVTTLSRKHIESRLPLVRRNIKGDLPPLRPDFIVIESTLLSAGNAADGLKEVHEYLDLAGSQCEAIILGRRPDWNLSSSHRVRVVPIGTGSAPNLAADLDSILTPRDSESGNTVWFAPDAPAAKVFLLVRERSTHVSDGGIVIESPHIFRMWGNVEVRGLQSKAHFVGRVSGVLRKDDWFRAQLKLGPKGEPSYAVEIASIAASPNLERTFQAQITQVRNPAVVFAPRTESQKKNDQPDRGLSRSKEKVSKAGGSEVIASISLDSATEYGRQLRTKKTVAKDTRGMIIGVSIIVLVVVGMIAAAIFSSNEGQKIYGDSFERLFQLRNSGKNQSDEHRLNQ